MTSVDKLVAQAKMRRERWGDDKMLVLPEEMRVLLAAGAESAPCSLQCGGAYYYMDARFHGERFVSISDDPSILNGPRPAA